MSDKTFFLKPEQIERLIEDPRACLATDRIVVDGEPVGYMYREQSAADEDSGWRFMAGDESAEYMGDASNVGVYALNSLANYDPDIIPLLPSPEGTLFARQEPGGELIPLPDLTGPSEPNGQTNAAADPHQLGLHPDYPVIEGEYQVTAEWSITLPAPCNRRIEEGSMVIWRPGLTLHLVAWDNTPGDSISQRIDQLLGSVSPDAVDLERVDEDGLTRVQYRLHEDGTDSIAAFAVSDGAQLLAQLYFDDEDTAGLAAAIAASITLVEANEPRPTH